MALSWRSWPRLFSPFPRSVLFLFSLIFIVQIYSVPLPVVAGNSTAAPVQGQPALDSPAPPRPTTALTGQINSKPGKPSGTIAGDPANKPLLPVLSEKPPDVPDNRTVAPTTAETNTTISIESSTFSSSTTTTTHSTSTTISKTPEKADKPETNPPEIQPPVAEKPPTKAETEEHGPPLRANEEEMDQEAGNDEERDQEPMGGDNDSSLGKTIRDSHKPIRHEEKVVPNHPETNREVEVEKEHNVLVYFIFFIAGSALILVFWRRRQRILAYLIEGRRSERRRAPGASYRKLKTNSDEE